MGNQGGMLGAVLGGAVWAATGPVLSTIGFATKGITAGSYAASMMSSTAIAAGGGVPAGSTVAVLQSIGAAGLSTPVGWTLVGTGALVGCALHAIFKKASPPHQWMLATLARDQSNAQLIAFADEQTAREAFAQATTVGRILFGVDRRELEAQGPEDLLQKLRELVASMVHA